MLIRIIFFFSTGFILIGCASAPRYSNSKATDEKQFENELKYSMKIFNEPIDILQDEFSNSDSMSGYSPDVARSGGKNKSNSFPNLENGFGVQIASFSSKKNADNYLSDLKKEMFIEYTIPDKPKSRNQKYRITEKGRLYLKEKTKHN